jgi:hypothetical protein
LSTTNPSWTDTGSNPGRRGGKPATNRLSYGAALRFHVNVGTAATDILLPLRSIIGITFIPH